MTAVSSAKPIRQDARRNERRVLMAARDVFIERGPAAPLEEIARRAEVGIGTLYRRFTDRQTLMRAVVLDALERTAEVAEVALAQAESTETDPTGLDGLHGLATYLHAAIDLRVSAVIPALLDDVSMDDPELRAASERAARPVDILIKTAQRNGTLRSDVTFGDVGTMLVRLSQPLPGPMDSRLQHALAHRHVDLLLAGLRPTAGPPLGGAGLTLAELRRIGRRATSRPGPDGRPA